MEIIAVAGSVGVALLGTAVGTRRGRSVRSSAMGHVALLLGAAALGTPCAWLWLGESIGRGPLAGVFAIATVIAVVAGGTLGLYWHERRMHRSLTVAQMVGAAVGGMLGACAGTLALWLGQHSWAEPALLALIPLDAASVAVATSALLAPPR